MTVGGSKPASYFPGFPSLPNKSPSGFGGGSVSQVGGGTVGFSGAFGSGGSIWPSTDEMDGLGGVGSLLRMLKSLNRMNPLYGMETGSRILTIPPRCAACFGPGDSTTQCKRIRNRADPPAYRQRVHRRRLTRRLTIHAPTELLAASLAHGRTASSRRSFGSPTSSAVTS